MLEGPSNISIALDFTWVGRRPSLPCQSSLLGRFYAGHLGVQNQGGDVKTEKAQLLSLKGVRSRHTQMVESNRACWSRGSPGAREAGPTTSPCDRKVSPVPR